MSMSDVCRRQTVGWAQKDDLYTVFTAFCKTVQNEKEFCISEVRSDHSGEFENEIFGKYFEKNGIFRDFSSPRIPQQNDVSEKRNRTLQEIACTMLHESNVANNFWVEVLNTACYFKNRILFGH